MPIRVSAPDAIIAIISPSEIMRCGIPGLAPRRALFVVQSLPPVISLTAIMRMATMDNTRTAPSRPAY